MDIRIYREPTTDAMAIRRTVFVEEQGFADDPDETDPVAAHLVMYDSDKAVAVCRTFPAENGVFMLGRFAVLAPYRSRGIGAALLQAAEHYARSKGAVRMALHSQWHAKGFYEHYGYIPHGGIEYEQNQPHIYMDKSL